MFDLRIIFAIASIIIGVFFGEKALHTVSVTLGDVSNPVVYSGKQTCIKITDGFKNDLVVSSFPCERKYIFVQLTHLSWFAEPGEEVQLNKNIQSALNESLSIEEANARIDLIFLNKNSMTANIGRSIVKSVFIPN